jgi:hypothetical protein
MCGCAMSTGDCYEGEKSCSSNLWPPSISCPFRNKVRATSPVLLMMGDSLTTPPALSKGGIAWKQIYTKSERRAPAPARSTRSKAARRGGQQVFSSLLDHTFAHCTLIHFDTPTPFLILSFDIVLPSFLPLYSSCLTLSVSIIMGCFGSKHHEGEQVLVQSPNAYSLPQQAIPPSTLPPGW